MKILTPPLLDNNVLGVITQSFNKNTTFLWVCAKFSKSIQIFAGFTTGMIGDEMGHLLECVELYGTFINKCEKSEYDQGIPQSQTADKPIATLGRATQQS